MNVLSPVIFDVKEVDSFHILEDSTIYSDMVRNKLLFRGLRQWYGTEWRLQELGRAEVLFSENVSLVDETGKGNDVSKRIKVSTDLFRR